MNKEFLEKSVETFCRSTFYTDFDEDGNYTKEDTEPFRIFIMGDLNDRYDAIKEFNIFGKTLKYNGESPKSCCHNWDSTCSEDYFYNPNDEKFKDTTSNVKYYETDKQIEYKGIQGGSHKHCQIPTNNLDKDGFKMAMPTQESMITRYKYKGDKVFGELPDDDKIHGKIEMFNFYNRRYKRSIESDHELVFATFPILREQKGGTGKRRSNTRKHHSKKSKNNRRTR